MAGSRDLSQIEYLTAKEVAEREGINPKTVKVRCQEGKYPGAYKAAPTAENPHGTWYIPKHLVGIIRDVAIVRPSSNMTAEDFLKAINENVQALVEPLHQKIENQTLEINNLKEQHTQELLQVKEDVKASQEASKAQLLQQLQQTRRELDAHFTNQDKKITAAANRKVEAPPRTTLEIVMSAAIVGTMAFLVFSIWFVFIRNTP